MTLVLLHGSGHTPAIWERTLAHLGGVPLVAPALPGRADVAWPAGVATRDVAGYAAAVLDVMDREEIASATIAGHSLGGAIALWLAIHEPARVDGIALVSTGARLRVRPEVLQALADGVQDAVDWIVNANTTPKTPDKDRVVLKRMTDAVGMEQTHQDLSACDAFDVMDALPSIRARTLVLAGREDVVTPSKYAEFLAERIPGARLVVYDGAGHALPLDRPEEVAGELAVLWAAAGPLTRR